MDAALDVHTEDIAAGIVGARTEPVFALSCIIPATNRNSLLRSNPEERHCIYSISLTAGMKRRSTMLS